MWTLPAQKVSADLKDQKPITFHFTHFHFHFSLTTRRKEVASRPPSSWGFGSVGPFRGALGPFRGVLGPFKVVIRSADYRQQKTEFKLCLLYHPLFERLYFRPVYPTIWYFRPVYPTIWQPISQNMNFRKSTAIALPVYPTIWQAISQYYGHPRDQAKDKKCINISQKLINGDIRVCRYLDVVVKIMGEYR